MNSYNADFLEFESRELLTERLTGDIKELLSKAIKKRGQASLVVSGGKTPIMLFKKLSLAELPWEKTSITLADERWVDIDDKDSNEQLVRTHLLKNNASNARFIGMKTGSATAEKGEKECTRNLRTIPTPFDVTILGMGLDGHTASFFPGAEKLLAVTNMDSGKICMSITPPTAPHERMTLTLPALLNSRHIIMHIEGEEKRQVYEEAVTGEPSKQMVVRMVFSRTKKPVSVYWAR